MKTRIARDVATARRPGRPIPAAMGTAGWAQAEADRARVRAVLRAPSDWKAPATTSVPASSAEHGAPSARGRAHRRSRARSSPAANRRADQDDRDAFSRATVSGEARCRPHRRSIGARGRSSGRFGRLWPARRRDRRRAVLRRPARMRRMRRGEESPSPQMRERRG